MTKERHDRVRAIITDHLGVDAEKVTDDATFEGLGADSLDGLELAMALEDEFKIVIDDVEIADAATVGQMLALVDKKAVARD